MSAKDIRNIVLLGHGGSGKTTLAESMLFMTGGTDRFGKVTDGNTTCDYDAEEIKRNISISLAVAPVKYKNVKINVLDTPGNFDFAGEVLSGIRAAECAVLVCGKRLVHAVRVAAVLSLGSSAVSALLAFYLTFVGAYSALTPVSMLLYLLLWALAALIEGFWADRY